MARAEPQRRADYPHLLAITTRWMDNDAYGHVKQRRLLLPTSTRS
jgi:acyl-CoA thioester hydrolase